jgi:methyl-accepting chemotaxis protein
MSISMPLHLQDLEIGSKIKLSLRIVGGFLIVLALAAMAIMVGYNGLSAVLSQVQGDRELGRLVMEIKNARLFEREFLTTNDPKKIKQVNARVVMVADGIIAAGDKFDLAVTKKELDQVAQQVKEYGQGFANYTKLAKGKEDAQVQMSNAGQTTLVLAEKIGDRQKADLVAFQKKSSDLLATSIETIEVAYTIKVDVTQAQAMAYAWELTPSDEAFDAWELPNMRIAIAVDNLKDKVTKDRDKADLEQLAKHHKKYKTSMADYMESKDGAKKAEAAQAAQKMIAAMDAFLQGQTVVFKVVREQMADAVDKRLAASGAAGYLVQLFWQVRIEEKNFVKGVAGADEKVRAGLNDIKGKIAELKSMFKGEEHLSQIKSMEQAVGTYEKAFDRFTAMTQKQKEALKKMSQKAQAAVQGCMNARNRQMSAMLKGMDRAQWLMGSAGLAAVVIGLFMAWLINRVISKPLREVMGNLDQGTTEVKQAAKYVTINSDNLAKGTSHQASSLQETSAALEQMASKTEGNADNARQAKELADQAKTAVESAAQNMAKVADAIQDLAQSGNEIAKIVGSVEEIAFQTNLLALNAAVEAARAGEAGAGFAVVSGEVRNLAGRASQAAQDTQALIATTVEHIKQCSSQVEQAQHSFELVNDTSAKQAVFIAEIADSSAEQNEGITQIKQAVVHIDEVVQETAAGAEESAAVAHTLNDQVAKLENVIDLIHIMLDGKDGGGGALKDTGDEHNHDHQEKILITNGS